MSSFFLLQIEKQGGSLDVIYKQAKVEDKFLNTIAAGLRSTLQYNSCFNRIVAL